MTPLITPAAMRDMERRYFDETGTASIDLMERAARTLCDLLIERYGSGRLIGFACGPGGNGGDGYACARLYRQAGGRAFLAAVGAPTSPDAIENLRRAQAAGLGFDEKARPDIWVDAIYGTGLNRAPGGLSAQWIHRINADRARGSRVVAVDIPSGLNGLTGRAYDPCIRADLTCTFQYPKAGLCLMDGLDVTGEVAAVDIGIPTSLYPSDSPARVDEADLRALLRPRPRNFHKGNAGHLLIVAGSLGMAGAAALCAGAALRSGAGLVTLACPRDIIPILQTLVPGAMCADIDRLDTLVRGKTAVVCGCGLSRQADPQIVKTVLSSGLPALLDADALNLISEHEDLKGMLGPNHLLTPHPGEAARLLGRQMEAPLADAQALRDLGGPALLKGAATVIAGEGRLLISQSGTSGMAVGGSGDALSGIIGSLMAQFPGEDLALLAAAGSELHGLAGEVASARFGLRGMTPQDLIDALPGVLSRYE